MKWLAELDSVPKNTFYDQEMTILMYTYFVNLNLPQTQSAVLFSDVWHFLVVHLSLVLYHARIFSFKVWFLSLHIEPKKSILVEAPQK